MPNYVFQFVLALSVGGAVLFALAWTCVVLWRRKYHEGISLFSELDRTALWRQALVISFWFAINYTLLVGANPYVSGPIVSSALFVHRFLIAVAIETDEVGRGERGPDRRRFDDIHCRRC